MPASVRQMTPRLFPFAAVGHTRRTLSGNQTVLPIPRVGPQAVAQLVSVGVAEEWLVEFRHQHVTGDVRDDVRIRSLRNHCHIGDALPERRGRIVHRQFRPEIIVLPVRGLVVHCHRGRVRDRTLYVDVSRTVRWVYWFKLLAA